MPAIRRFLPLILLATAFAAIWWSGLARELTWAGLARHQAELTGWVRAHPVLAWVGYVGIYTASTALSLPQASLLSVAGGLLFGAFLATALTVTGATAGAVVLFLAARTALGQSMERRGGTGLARLREALRRDGFSYLLAMRLVPVFPFWLLNLAASVCGMRLGTFALATFIGIIPGTFVFSWIGAGLGSVLAAGQTPDLSVIFSLPVLGPLLALAVLSLLPIAWKRWRRTDA